MPGIPDTCETPGCPNLAAPGQRYCLVCLTRLVDGRATPVLDVCAVEAPPHRAGDWTAYQQARTISILTNQLTMLRCANDTMRASLDDKDAALKARERALRQLQEVNQALQDRINYQAQQMYITAADAEGLRQQVEGLRAQLQAYINGAALSHTDATRALPNTNGGMFATLRRLFSGAR